MLIFPENIIFVSTAENGIKTVLPKACQAREGGGGGGWWESILCLWEANEKGGDKNFKKKVKKSSIVQLCPAGLDFRLEEEAREEE